MTSTTSTSHNPASAPLRVGYLIPEFPGQTHVWMWREIVHMREAGADLHLFSTRRPPERDKARHDFAEAAAAETTYLWPMSAGAMLSSLAWAVCTKPLGLLRAVRWALTLPVEKKPNLKTVLPLVIPACKLARDVRRRGLSHLHSHTCANSAVLAMLVKALQGTPYSLTLNANIEWWGGAMAEKFGRADFTIAITEWLEVQVRRDYPELGDDQVVLGRIGVDTKKWKPSSEARPKQDALQIITVGRLHTSKGYDVLLDALGQLQTDGIAFQLTMIGDGPDRQDLVDQAEQLGLTGRVTFTGSLGETQIIDAMRSSDVFVLSSHAEPLGVVSMEAMAMEVATIATDAGGVGEIITDDEDGKLVPPGNAQALAGALREMAEDDALRTRLAQAGRQSIIRNFDSRRGAATLFERLTGQRPDAMLAVLDDDQPADQLSETPAEVTSHG
ncbi:MAG: glycosyltransferase family 4 protein [Planctomycetota bacterium]